MARKRKIDIEEINEFEDDVQAYCDITEHELDDIINEIMHHMSPDDPITLDNLQVVIEWVRRKL